MLKISTKASVMLSLVISVLFAIALIVGAVIMPWLVDVLIKLPDNIGNRAAISNLGKTLCLILSYLILAACMLADALIFALLKRVYKGNVFSSKSVALIRGISWCCFLVAVLFLAVGYYFQLALVVAFAAVFLGLCVRVVKNVIEQATEIKCENDLTV